MLIELMVIVVFVLFTSLGCFFVIRNIDSFIMKNSDKLILLTVGLFLAIAAFDLIPSAISLSLSNIIFVIIGIALMHIIHYVLNEQHLSVTNKQISYLPFLLVIILHSFIDGVNLSVSLMLNGASSLSALGAWAIHKLIEGISITFFLLSISLSHYQAFKRILYITLFSLIGNLAAWYLIRTSLFDSKMVGQLIGFTAGIFIYFAFSETISFILSILQNYNSFYIKGFKT